MNKKPSALSVLAKMADLDLKEFVFAFPLNTNFKYARTGREGWGEVTIAVTNHIIANIDKFSGSLYMADKDAYADIEKTLEQEGAAFDEMKVRAEAAEAKVAALQAALEEEGRRNAVFTACLHKAQNLYLEAHPDYPGWPDGAVNITWVLEAFDKERAEVKRLQTALAAANEDAGYLADAAEMLVQKWGSDDVVMFDFARISAVIEHYRARVGAS